MKSSLNFIQIFSGILSTTLQRISFSFFVIDLLNDTSRMSVGSCALRTEQSVSCYHKLCFIQWEISESLWILLCDWSRINFPSPLPEWIIKAMESSRILKRGHFLSEGFFWLNSFMCMMDFHVLLRTADLFFLVFHVLQALLATLEFHLFHYTPAFRPHPASLEFHKMTLWGTRYLEYYILYV